MIHLNNDLQSVSKRHFNVYTHQTTVSLSMFIESLEALKPVHHNRIYHKLKMPLFSNIREYFVNRLIRDSRSMGTEVPKSQEERPELVEASALNYGSFLLDSKIGVVKLWREDIELFHFEQVRKLSLHIST